MLCVAISINQCLEAADWFGFFFFINSSGLIDELMNWFSSTYDHDNISCVTHLKTNIKNGKSQKWKYETSESKSKYWCQVNPNTNSSTIPFPMLNLDPYWHLAHPPPGLLHLWQCDGADLFTFVPVSTEAVVHSLPLTFQNGIRNCLGQMCFGPNHEPTSQHCI